MTYVHRIFILFTLLCASIAHTYANPRTAQNRNVMLDSACAQWQCLAFQEALDKGSIPAPTGPIKWPESGEFSGFGPANFDAQLTQFQNDWMQDNRFVLVSALADLYLPLFRKKVAQHGLPEPFLYLPMALTGLNPSYVSHDG
ncbi:MAG: hypothetical protein JNM00_11160, partial [Flavobacteriales bacterium]|nr:hypothetical protein [Flavobacteriales bacterium]